MGPIALLDIPVQYWVFAAAGVISLLAFVALIMVPAVGSYGRIWEKLVAGLLSTILFVSLLGFGIALGILVIYNWDKINGVFS